MEERYKLFTVLITDIFRSIKKLKTEEMSKYGLKSIHLSCLHYIYNEGAMSLKEVCDACRDDKANVSRSLRSLAEKGYLKNDPLHQNKFVLTESGLDLTVMLEKRIVDVIFEASRGLTDESRKAMYDGLDLICDNLSNLCKNR